MHWSSEQIKVVRTKYGSASKIIKLGDFNARVGNDGSDNMTEEYNDENEECANGKFSFVETDDNGAELLTFCVTTQFKIMDSYFERQDGEFGTWASNRSNDKGFKAALDHILVSGALWGEVVACGVYIPTVRRWNTDHRMVELDLGQCSVGRSEDAGTERKQVRKCEDTSGPMKLQQACTMVSIEIGPGSGDSTHAGCT